jgi:hypothetical protein
MPNRILKETICTSEEVEALSPEQEVFFYRLMVVCDDFGLMDARPAILKARCYPLKSIDIKRIQLNLDVLQQVGLISTYMVAGKPYLHIANWEKHQQIRAKRAKYPMPSESDSTCNQLISDAPVIQSNPIQSESNPNPIQSAGKKASPQFEQAWTEYPRKGDTNKRGSLKAWNARVSDGEDPDAMLAGVIRYAAYCRAMQTENAYIKQPATFFGPDKHYLTSWEIPQRSPHANHRNTAADTIAAFTGQRQPAVPEGSSGVVVEGSGTRV